MEFHMINITYAALHMCAQTEKTTFSCKDDCTLTKHTGRWTYSTRYFEIPLCRIPPLRSFFKNISRLFKDCSKICSRLVHIWQRTVQKTFKNPGRQLNSQRLHIDYTKTTQKLHQDFFGATQFKTTSRILIDLFY